MRGKRVARGGLGEIVCKALSESELVSYGVVKMLEGHNHQGISVDCCKRVLTLSYFS